MIKPKLLLNYLKPKEFYIELYDQSTKIIQDYWEQEFASMIADPTPDALEEMRKYLTGRLKRDFTNEEVERENTNAWNLASVFAVIGIKEDREKGKEKTIRVWIRTAKEKNKKILNTKPFEEIKCSVCSSLMNYKWSDLFEDKDSSSVLFFYECCKCSKREAIFEDGKLFVSKSQNNCPRCQSKRSVTLTKNTEGKIFLIHDCQKCGCKEVEDGPQITNN